MRSVYPWTKVVAAGIVVAISACAGATSETSMAGVPAELGAVVMESDVGPTAPGWAVAGTARVAEIPRSSDLALQLEVTGLTPGAHAWHIHNGGCANPGAVVVPFSAAGSQAALDGPVNADIEGEATEDARIPASRLTRAQLEGGDFSLHIHNGDGANMGRSVACANL